MNQLVRVNDPNDPTGGENGTTWLYTYDRGGNMKERIAYQYSTAEQPQNFIRMWANFYEDPNWKDKLTDSNGITVDYDANGNPTEYWGWEYTWEKGRQLKKAHYIYGDPVTMEFKYNHEGIRTQKIKKVNGTVTETTDYILMGKTVAAMKKNTDTYYFTYDASGKPATVTYNGVKYTYVKNLQGDIVAILDASGNLVVEYKYDAWGAPISIYSASTTVDALAFDTPFRYRGYVWDEESGLYYLRSRYYNPRSCRFVNSDIVNERFIYSRVDNCYSYCNCCPLMYIDDDGFVGTEFDLGQGWKFRIDPGNPDGKVQRHIHVWKKGGPHHAQNKDGSVHEKYYGMPPKWVRDKLRKLRKWDWKETDQSAVPKPTPNPTPAPTPAPGPVPPSYPVHDSETEKQKDYSNINVNTTELVVIEIIGVIGACIVAGIKLAASFATGGMIPAW